MFPIQVCEPCAENGTFKAGVYRDWIGQVLCDACDDARLLAHQEAVDDYGRPGDQVGDDYESLMRREG